MASASSLPRDLATEIGVEDLYEYLGVSSASTDKEITTGYRKKALIYHPDKNPDDPNAADLFEKLSKAYSILTDPAAKGAYDKWLKAKQAAKVRHEELNAKRRKLKESLESRESQLSTRGWSDEREAAKKMQKEIERLRDEGFRKIHEQEEILRRQLQAPPPEDNDDLLPTLKVTWRAKTSDPTNGGYSKESLAYLFSKFGPVHHVLVSSKKTGKALVSFQHTTSTLCTLDSGIGIATNPLKISWVSGAPSTTNDRSVPSGASVPVRSVKSVPGGGVGASVPVRSVKSVPGGGVGASVPVRSVKSVPGGGVGASVPVRSVPVRSVETADDYESLTLMRLRQAEERKRLNQQLLLEQQEPS